MRRMFLWVAGAVLRKKTWDLAGFTARPEALAKRDWLFFKLLASWTEGCPMSMVSSMNYWWVCGSMLSYIQRPFNSSFST